MGTNTRPSLLLWPALIRLPLDNRSRDYIYSPPWAAVQGLRFILLNGLSKLVPFPVTCYKRKVIKTFLKGRVSPPAIVVGNGSIPH
jgi:hypothetical protein